MPRKLSFTENDLKFLFRLTERVRQKDRTLGFDKRTLSEIERVFPYEVFQEKYHIIVELANDNLLSVLDAEQRKKLSKARYAFQKKRESRQVKLDATGMAKIHLKSLIELLKDDLETNESLDESKVTQKQILEAALDVICKLSNQLSSPTQYKDIDKFVRSEIIARLKETKK